MACLHGRVGMWGNDMDRRRLLRSGKAAEPEIDWSLSVLERDTTIPFPYSEYKYALVWKNNIISSDSPFYMYKASKSSYYIVSKQPYNLHGKTMIDLTVDTSDLGDGIYLIARYSDYATVFGGCNYPVLEVRYNDDNTKLYVVRE